MISPNGQFGYQDFLNSQSKYFKKKKEMESFLHEICQSTTNAKGVEIFSVKHDKLSLFDPFYYISSSEISKSMDPIQAIFKKLEDKKMFDGIFGGIANEINADLKPLDINILFIDTLSNSNILQLAINAILAKDKSKISEMISLCSHKILQIFGDSSKKLIASEQIKAIIKNNQKEILEEIKKNLNKMKFAGIVTSIWLM